jgi:hypothetical protein
MWAKLTHADQWYSRPVFVHLSDVDERTGPLEYVPRSTRHGRYTGEWPWRPLSTVYPAQADFQRRIPDSAARTPTGPEGSMIFCNTSGFHRGGHVTEKPRKLWVFHYVSPAALRSLADRNFELDAAAVADLSEVERLAVTYRTELDGIRDRSPQALEELRRAQPLHLRCEPLAGRCDGVLEQLEPERVQLHVQPIAVLDLGALLGGKSRRRTAGRG